MKKQNKILKVQEIIFDELERLDNDEIMGSSVGEKEINRSKAISASAHSFIKSINLSLRIKDIAKKQKIKEKDLLKELHITND